MPTAEVEVREKRKGTVLTDSTALHIRAIKDFTDIYGVERRAGQEYLIDKSVTDVHILDSKEELVQEKRIIALASNQYVVIRNPIGSDGRPQYGIEELRKGETKFFLQPGEVMIDWIKNILVIHEDEAVVLRAKVDHTDKRTKKVHKAGSLWMINGPLDFIPDNEVEVVEKRKSQPLSENEGIYVRDMSNGEVKLVRGP